MSRRKTSKNINQLFEEFLAEQERRLASKTYSKYVDMIDLFRRYLESYWPGQYDRNENTAITEAGGNYCGTFGADDIVSGFSEFLGYFIPYKVIGGSDTMKSAGTVMKKLGKWLAENGYTKINEWEREHVAELARDLPASQKLLALLDDWLAENVPENYKNEIQGHFQVERIEPGKLWLGSMITGDSHIGPIPVPAKVSRACKVGWDIGGIVGRTPQGWRLIEVWNLAP